MSKCLSIIWDVTENVGAYAFLAIIINARLMHRSLKGN
jgi:hypothetical protein